MFAERQTVSVTTDASGDATVYSGTITGAIHAIHYVPNDFAATVDFAITLEATGEVLWQESNLAGAKKVYPVVPANIGSTGAASTLTEKPFVAANDRVKIVIAQGGNAKSGAFRIVKI